MPTPAATPVLPPAEEVERGTSLWNDALHRFRKNRIAALGLGFVIMLALVALAAPLLVRVSFIQSYDRQDLAYGAHPPSARHWMGTDVLGRDLLSRVIHGSRISLAVGLCATVVSLTIGVLYGAISGYLGGKTDVVMMRIVDILYALPFTVFVILLMVIFGRNIILLFMAIGAVEWLTVARIVRGQVLSLRQQEFIEAAIALGLRKRAIVLRHLVPNVLGVTIVYATLTVPSVMLLEAVLSFLGFGVQPPMSSLGVLIEEGARNIEEFPWLIAFPGVVFSLTLFSLNFVGDGLRDALDVRSSKD
jgi:oligopeptide transport system permease protein